MKDSWVEEMKMQGKEQESGIRGGRKRGKQRCGIESKGKIVTRRIKAIRKSAEKNRE